MRMVLRFALALALLGWQPPAFACTTFCFIDGGQILFGKNYDWYVEHGLLIVNQRGVLRRAAPREPGRGEPARWEARHGSVTFNQYGRGFPSGGINEAGLVIELMWLDEGRYPAPDSRPVVGVLEWIQFQLDTAATVAEVIASDSKVRIQGQSPLHYLVADRAGAVAAVEFLGGRMVVHTGGDLPLRALTNSPYADSVAYHRRADEGAGPGRYDSLRRFSAAARFSERFKAGDAAASIAYAFDALAAVGQPSTQWSIVYDIGAREVHFRTRRQPSRRSVSLDALDFSCGPEPLALDLHAPGSGRAEANLRPLTAGANLALVRASYAETDFLSKAGEEEIRAVAGHPDTDRCAGSAP